MRTTKTLAEDSPPAVHHCHLPLSTRTITSVADLLRGPQGHRITVAKLRAGKITVIVLADLRLTDMTGGNNVLPGTVRRWVGEVIDPLAARAAGADQNEITR